MVKVSDLTKYDYRFAEQAFPLFKMVAEPLNDNMNWVAKTNDCDNKHANDIANRAFDKLVSLIQNNPDDKLQKLFDKYLHNFSFDNVLPVNCIMGYLENLSEQCIQDGDFFNNYLYAKFMYRFTSKPHYKYYNVVENNYYDDNDIPHLELISEINSVTMVQVCSFLEKLGFGNYGNETKDKIIEDVVKTIKG